MIAFSWKRLGVLWFKECVDSFRDHRALLMMVLPALIAGPLFLSAVFYALSSQTERAQSPTLYVQGENNAPSLITFLQRQQVIIAPLPDDYENKIKRGDIAIAMIVPPTFPEEIAEGNAGTIRLIYDHSRSSATATIAQVERVISAYQRLWGQQRLIARGIAPEVAIPFSTRITNLATPQQSGALILSLVAFYTLFATLVGGMAIALDLSAGERERNSLSPLLLTPVSPIELILGKWATVSLINGVFVGLTLLGFYLTLAYAPLPAIGVPFLFRVPEALKFIAVLFPLLILFPALFLLIGFRGQSVREAQATTSLVLLIFSIIPVLQMLLPQKEAVGISAIPVAGHYAMLIRVLRGEALPLMDMMLIYGVPLALLILLIFFAARVVGARK